MNSDQEASRAFFEGSGLSALAILYAYEEGARQAFITPEGGDKWRYMRAYGMALSSTQTDRVWAAAFMTGGKLTSWGFMSAYHGGEYVSGEAYPAAAALRALLEKSEDMDEAASTIMLLPRVQWRDMDSNKVTVELRFRAAARAWLECGGKAALLPAAYGWVGM